MTATTVQPAPGQDATPADSQTAAADKEALWRRIRESAVLFVVPWIAVYGLLWLVHWMQGSSALSGIWKLLVLLGSALFILVYERWFISVTSAALKDAPGGSRYIFSKADFLRKVDDGATDAALATFCGDPSSGNRVKVLEQLRTADNEGFKRLTQVVDKLQTRIGEEYSDIHSRTGWLVAGQAFLLAGFVSVLNADPQRLSADSKQWLTIGIGLAGAAISFVIALSIFYGTALVEALKGPRDAAEDLADTEFKVPRTGVRSKTGIHIFSHYATRYIPCLAYLAWITLTLLAMNEAFSQTGQTAPPGGGAVQPGGGVAPLGGDSVPPAGGGAPPGGGGVPPGGGGVPPGGGAAPPGGDGGVTPPGAANPRRGWKQLESSPSFARGAATFEAPVTDCPNPQETHEMAEKWRNSIVMAWERRDSASNSDVLILVGSADRISLAGALKHQYDTNMGLARRRAEAIKAMLIQATGGQPQRDKLTDDRILVLVTGPQHSPKPEKAGRKEKCEQFSDDRRVQVWMPGA